MDQLLKKGQDKRKQDEPQTHTYFGKKPVMPLTLDEDDITILFQELFKNYQKQQTKTSSFSEKILTNSHMKFVIDIDFEIDNFDKDQDIPSTIKEINKIVHDQVNEITGQQEMIVTHRSYYKEHLYFPSLIVSVNTAKALAKEIENKIFPVISQIIKIKKDKNHVIDISIYSTGLRLLFCHKGAMRKNQQEMNKEKREKKLYEAKFGLHTWSDFYKVVDSTSLESVEPQLEHLIKTRLMTCSNVTFEQGSINQISLINQITSTSNTTATKKSSDISRALNHLSKYFEIPVSKIDVKGMKIKDKTIIIPVKSKDCPFAKRSHSKNNLYIVINDKQIELKCHNKTFCKNSKKVYYIKDMASDIQDVIRDILPVAVNEKEEFCKVIQQPLDNVEVFDKMNLTTANEKKTTMGYWTCTLPMNFYCPICELYHDRPENFIQLSPTGQRGIGCSLRHGEFYPNPLQIIATTNIFNTIINNYQSGDELIGDLFPTEDVIFEGDAQLNSLMYSSFKGFDTMIANVFVYLGKDKFGVSSVSDNWWAWNEDDRLWLQSNRMAEHFCRTKVAEKYIEAQQYFEKHTENKDLKMQRIARLDTIRRKLYGKDKSTILHEAAITFGLKQKDFENKLNSNKHLIAFKGKTFDFNTLELRDSSSEDYITITTGYELPTRVDPDIRSEIKKFINSIMETSEAVDYLLKFLASTLDGYNREEIFTICTGIGRNGKGVLRDLLAASLGEYYHDIQASMLTHERPSSSAPCPDLLLLKGKRLVTGSEPEKNASINSGFIKFLTGNDPISGRYCHQNDNIRFEPQHSLILWCNKIPALPSEDEAVWARSRVIDFPFRFTSRPENSKDKSIDDSLKSKVKNWGPQFMLILLEYYAKYKQTGLAPTQQVILHTTQIREENDVIKSWIKEHIENKENSVLNRADAWREYKKDGGKEKQSDFFISLTKYMGGDAKQFKKYGGIRGWKHYCIANI